MNVPFAAKNRISDACGLTWSISKAESGASALLRNLAFLEWPQVKTDWQLGIIHRQVRPHLSLAVIHPHRRNTVDGNSMRPDRNGDGTRKDKLACLLVARGA